MAANKNAGQPHVAATILQPLNMSGRNIPWEQANCKNHENPDIFHPDGENKRSTAEAKAVCNGTEVASKCPILTRCKNYALENQLHGVWGGTDWNERRDMRKNKKPRLPGGAWAA